MNSALVVIYCSNKSKNYMQYIYFQCNICVALFKIIKLIIIIIIIGINIYFKFHFAVWNEKSKNH